MLKVARRGNTCSIEEEKLETIDITISTSSEPEFALDSLIFVRKDTFQSSKEYFFSGCSSLVVWGNFYLSLTRGLLGYKDRLSVHQALRSKISEVEAN